MSFFLWLCVFSGLLLPFLLVFFLRRHFAVVLIRGHSMAPTLKQGERVLVLHPCPNRWLHKGQIIVVQPERSSEQARAWLHSISYVKRIIALGGDTLTLPAHPHLQVESVIAEETLDRQEEQTWHIPEKHLFVCGDNLPHSIDSRTWGPISMSSVLGVVLLKLSSRTQPAVSSLPTLPPLAVGQRAPSFSAISTSGQIATLETFQGRSLLLLFLSDSRISRPLIPAWQELAARLESRNIVTIFICDQDEERTRDLVARYALTQLTLVAPRNEHPFLDDYHVRGTPAYCLIDEAGNVQASGFPNQYSPAWRALNMET
ncbi:MAG TPA: signal peptidase I [Ktedonobacteraceae bacterium]|nr:signal peptidase I [Ktedonobacteraceae bacterium]